MKPSKQRDSWLIFKIDISKAFDTFSWNFIDNILKIYNFPQEFSTLLLSCLKNVTYIPIINGKKTSSFSPSRGIKKGDPISPYVFVRAMEYLIKLIHDQIQVGN